MSEFFKKLTKFECEKMLLGLDLLKSQTKNLNEKDRIQGTQNKLQLHINQVWRKLK